MALVHTWTHKSPDGTAIGEIRRYIDDSGKKRDIPHYNNDGKSFATGIPSDMKDQLYPLFGADTIRDLEKPVFIVEGQKCQAAMAGLGFQCVTSILGATNAALSDWSSLRAAQKIVLLMDNDSAGENYGKDVYRLCLGEHSPQFRILRLSNLPLRGDVCDWLKQQPELSDWNEYDTLAEHRSKEALLQRFSALVSTIAEEIPEDWRRENVANDQPWAGTTIPKDFSLTGSGLFLVFPDGDETRMEKISSPCWISAFTRSCTGDGWGAVVHWFDRDGKEHQRAIPIGRFHEQGNGLAQDLASEGLAIIPGQERKLTKYLGSFENTVRHRSVDKLGWLDTTDGELVFVIPTTIIRRRDGTCCISA